MICINFTIGRGSHALAEERIICEQGIANTRRRHRCRSIACLSVRDCASCTVCRACLVGELSFVAAVPGPVVEDAASSYPSSDLGCQVVVRHGDCLSRGAANHAPLANHHRLFSVFTRRRLAYASSAGSLGEQVSPLRTVLSLVEVVGNPRLWCGGYTDPGSGYIL